MGSDSKSRSVTVVFVSVVILAVAVAGILFSDIYSSLTGSGEEIDVAEFNPNRFPPPSAGVAGKGIYARNCNDIVYRTTKDGIKYVRLSGGGTVIGTEIEDEFRFYKVEYGQFSPVDRASVDSFTQEKLNYALNNCDGPFLPSGINF